LSVKSFLYILIGSMKGRGMFLCKIKIKPMNKRFNPSHKKDFLDTLKGEAYYSLLNFGRGSAITVCVPYSFSTCISLLKMVDSAWIKVLLRQLWQYTGH